MTDTANLGLPCIEGSQAQKHVTHNDALRILDTLVQLAVLDRDLTAPPGSPSEGQRWIVKATGTGAWAGHNNAIAAWQDGGWQFSAPQAGWVAFVADEGTLLLWNGTAWGDFFSTVTSIQNLALLGVGTTADTTNRLSAKLNNTLFVAKTVAEGGDGSLRYKLSKESAAKTLSFLLQDNYSGRAEIGLTGDDDFHFKVSPDGSSWYEAIKIAAATGKVTFPVSGGPREGLSADRTYYVRADGSDGNNGLTDSAGGAFLTWQHAIDVVKTLDLAGYNVVIQAGGSSGTFTGPIVVTLPFVGATSPTAVKLRGDTTTPTNFLLQTTTSSSVLTASYGGQIAIEGFQLKSTGGGHLLDSFRPGSTIVVTGKMDFSSTTANQMYARRQGYIEITGVSYTISAGAASHFTANNLALLGVGSCTITLTGTPAFATAFLVSIANGNANLGGNTYVGSATGQQYSLSLNSSAATGGATLPGNAAGTTATGGQYS